MDPVQPYSVLYVFVCEDWAVMQVCPRRSLVALRQLHSALSVGIIAVIIIIIIIIIAVV